MDEFLKLYGSTPKTEDVRFVSENNKFNFGKYKGLSYGEVFENHKDYIIWILKMDSVQRKYFNKAYLYFKDRIEREAKEQ